MFKVGDRVEIVGEPHTGCRGTIKAIDDDPWLPYEVHVDGHADSVVGDFMEALFGLRTTPYAESELRPAGESNA